MEKKTPKNEGGFTLIEMLVVLFIIGLILAIAIPNLKAAGEKASSQADRANRRLIAAQADNYFLEYGSYPTSVEELVKRNYLRSVPACPGGGTYVINRNPDAPAEERVTCKR